MSLSLPAVRAWYTKRLHDFYDKHFAEADIGSARIYVVPVNEENAYRVTADTLLIGIGIGNDLPPFLLTLTQKRLTRTFTSSNSSSSLLVMADNNRSLRDLLDVYALTHEPEA